MQKSKLQAWLHSDKSMLLPRREIACHWSTPCAVLLDPHIQKDTNHFECQALCCLLHQTRLQIPRLHHFQATRPQGPSGTKKKASMTHPCVQGKQVGREREKVIFKRLWEQKLNKGSCVPEIKTYGYVHHSDSTQTTELSTYNL